MKGIRSFLAGLSSTWLKRRAASEVQLKRDIKEPPAAKNANPVGIKPRPPHRPKPRRPDRASNM